MSFSNLFSSFSIKKKIRTIITLFLIVQIALTVFMVFNVLSVEKNMTKASIVKTQLIDLKNLKAGIVDLTLVAMDSIVDKEEGAISNERLQELNLIEQNVLKTFTTVQSILASNPVDSLKSDELKAEFSVLIASIRNDLKSAIEARAPAEEFARLDDLIDGNASALIEKIEKIESVITKKMESVFSETSNEGNLLLIYIAVQFFITWILLFALTRFINREIIDPLTVQIDNTLDSIKMASNDLRLVAETLFMAAEKTESHSSHGASASHQASSNVQNVASASEELSISIAEIRRQIQLSSEVSQLAVKEAENATAIISRLDAFSSRIGDIVTTITAIAEKTNLLALNATIESARAGEMGKGFAVVASEVKNLATQTSQATDEISSQIKQMQGLVKDAVAAIGNIKDTISDMDGSSSSVMNSISQQTTATGEISRGLNEASTGVQESSRLMDVIAQSVKNTRADISRVEESIKSLEDRMKTARNDVDSVLYGTDKVA
jgi:methyl-accepting chemotaxis protein